MYPLAERLARVAVLLVGSALLVLTFPVASAAQNLLSWPESVVFDTLYNRYLVSNWNSGTIVQINSNGVQSYFVTGENCQAGLEIVGDSVYVGCSAQGVKGFNLHTGELIMHVTIPGSLLLNDVTSDTSGNIYVTDVDANRIFKIRLADHSYSTFVSSGISDPNGILFDKKNNRLLLVSTRTNSPIQAISLADSTVSTLVMTGLNDLDGLAMNKQGNLYVSSWGTRAVYIFTPDLSGTPRQLFQSTDGPADVYYNSATDSLMFPLLYGNRVASLNQSGVNFARVKEGPLWDDIDCSHGLHWIDYNNDGYLDLYITSWFVDGDHANVLYTNDGNGGFTKVATGDIVTDVQSVSGSWADIDNDGDIDGFVGHSILDPTPQNNYLYINNGDGTFTKLATGSVVTDLGHTNSAVWGDFDNDGDVDLIAGNHCWAPCTSGGGLLCYRNDGDSLAAVDHTLLGFPDGDNAFPSACDFDADGDLDIVYRRDEKSNRVFRNQGNWTFEEDVSVAFAADSSIGFSWADFDNDGDFDLLTTSNTASRLYVNNAGVFSRVSTGSYNPGSGPWFSGAWGDLDNDGDQDVVLASMTGMYLPRANALLINNGDGTFTKEIAGPIATDLETSIGAGWADYDRDGDLDLLIVNNNYSHNALYENGGNNNSWIAINCVGTLSNRSGIGAKIYVVATIFGDQVRQLQMITSQSGAHAQMPLEAHFGLGDATVIDSVIVDWPSGITNTWLDVPVNQNLTVTEFVNFDCGDANRDGDVNVGDAVFLINYVFKGGSAPSPVCAGDANNDGNPNVGDAVYLINYVFKGGPLPSEGCCL